MENLKTKILIVDDEQEIRIMIERFLRKEGFFAFILLLTALLLCHFASRQSRYRNSGCYVTGW